MDILAKQIPPSLPSATAESDFILSGPTPFSWVKKTLAQVISLLGLAGLFEIDVNGGLMPVTDTVTDEHYELDENDDIMPKAV